MVVAATGAKTIANVEDVARFFLIRAFEDGDYVSNLRMQKLVYYAYCWTLVKHGQRLFVDRIQAWPSGPVVPALYEHLRRYGSAPIGEDFLDSVSKEDLAHRFPPDVLATLEQVYQIYGSKLGFELTVSTQQERPWVEARQGLSPTDTSVRAISDSDIEEAFPAIIMEELL
jgi:uncharacterized phage-associated protein